MAKIAILPTGCVWHWHHDVAKQICVKSDAIWSHFRPRADTINAVKWNEVSSFKTSSKANLFFHFHLPFAIGQLICKIQNLSDQTGLEHSRCGPYVTSNGFRGHLHHLAIMCCNQDSDMWFLMKRKLLIYNLWLDFVAELITKGHKI